MSDTSNHPSDPGIAMNLSAVAEAADFMTDPQLAEFAAALERGPGITSRRGKTPLISVPATSGDAAVHHQTKEKHFSSRILAGTCTAVGVCVLAIAGVLVSQRPGGPQFEASLTIDAPDGTTLTRAAATTAHADDIVRFSCVLTSDKEHRWGLHLNDQLATLFHYSGAQDGTSRIDDALTLDARTSIEFYMIIAADNPLPDLPVSNHGPQTGTTVGWLTRICPDFQTLDAAADLDTQVRDRAIAALRDAGYDGPVEVFVRHFFHNENARQRRL